MSKKRSGLLGGAAFFSQSELFNSCNWLKKGRPLKETSFSDMSPSNHVE